LCARSVATLMTRPPWRDVLDRRGEGRSSNRVDDRVEVTVDRIDDGCGAERAELVAAFLDVAYECCDVGAGESRELHRVLANSSGCSRYEHALGELRAGQVERAHGGQTGGGKRCRFGVRHGWRQDGELRGRNGDELGPGAPSHESNHARSRRGAAPISGRALDRAGDVPANSVSVPTIGQVEHLATIERERPRRDERLVRQRCGSGRFH
jgi:hypothetical protein